MDLEKFYARIAKENGVTVEQVKADMMAAIEAAWNNPDKTKEQEDTQRIISPSGEVPDLDTYITEVVKLIRKNAD